MRAIHLTMIAAIVAAPICLAGPSWAQDKAAPQAVPAPPAGDAPVPPATAPARQDAPKKAPAAIPPNPPSVTVIDSGYARAILGRDVRSSTDENMGRIADIIVDRGGQVRAAVIDFGGFLGVGSRKIVVDWNALRFSNVANKGESTILELTRDQVKAAPEYKEDQPIIVLGASGKLEPMRFRLLMPNE